MLWINSSQWLSTIQLPAHSPLLQVGQEEKIRAKARNLVDWKTAWWVKERGRRKGTKRRKQPNKQSKPQNKTKNPPAPRNTHKAKLSTCCLPQTNQSPASLLSNAYRLQKPPPLSLYCCTWHGIPLWSVLVSCWLCPLPTSCTLPIFLLGAQRWSRGEERTLMLCRLCSAAAKTLVSFQRSFSHESKT